MTDDDRGCLWTILLILLVGMVYTFVQDGLPAPGGETRPFVDFVPAFLIVGCLYLTLALAVSRWGK